MNSSLQQLAAPATPRRIPVERFRRQSRGRLLRADLLTVIAWASVSFAVALWLADGGATGFSTPAGSFTALGIVAGLAGMDLVLLMLLLVARTPLIVVTEAPGVVSIELTGRHLDELAGSGGRFFIWRFFAPGMWWHPHPFSLSAEPVLFDSSGRGRLRITVRNLGRGSAQLARVKEGTRVAVEGPYWLFSTAARSRNRVVMIGAGIGITPIPALLERTPFEPGNATVLLRGHSEAELFLGEEVLELCRRRGATLFYLTGHRTAGDQSWLPESAVHAGHRLASYAPDIADSDVYICGPDAWARSVISAACAAGAREEQLACRSRPHGIPPLRVPPGVGGGPGHRHRGRAGDSHRRRRKADAELGHGQLGHRGARRPRQRGTACDAGFRA